MHLDSVRKSSKEHFLRCIQAETVYGPVRRMMESVASVFMLPWIFAAIGMTIYGLICLRDGNLLLLFGCAFGVLFSIGAIMFIRAVLKLAFLPIDMADIRIHAQIENEAKNETRSV